MNLNSRYLLLLEIFAITPWMFSKWMLCSIWEVEIWYNNGYNNSMEQTWKQKIFSSLRFWWIALTVIHFSISFLPMLSFFAGFVGLFVPLSVWNFLGAVGTPAIFFVFVIPVVILVVYGGEYFLGKMNLSPFKKFFFMVTILFLLTMLVDFIIWGRWQSLIYFQSGGAEFFEDSRV